MNVRMRRCDLMTVRLSNRPADRGVRHVSGQPVEYVRDTRITIRATRDRECSSVHVRVRAHTGTGDGVDGGDGAEKTEATVFTNGGTGETGTNGGR